MIHTLDDVGQKEVKKAMTYVITETCVGCGKCEPECPVSAIKEGSPFKIDVDKCVDCGLCDELCPVDAIYRKM